MAEETFYSVLEVPETASDAEIKTAWRRLISEVHPDKVANAPAYWRRQAEGKSKQINEAFAVLSDPAKRRLYDAQIAYRKSQNSDSRTSAQQSTGQGPNASAQQPSQSSGAPSSAPQQAAPPWSTASNAHAVKRRVWAVIGIVALLLLIGNVPELFRSLQRLFTNRQTNDDQSSARSSTGSSAPVNSDSAAVSELHFTPEQLKDYYAVYSTRDVRYLRTLFNAYLKGTAGHDSEFELLRGLSTDYYRSKFIVYSRSPGEFGGNAIDLIFQEKPDRVFYAWVYRTAGGEMELRSFEPAEKITDQDMSRIRIMFRTLLEDRQHAM